MLFDLTTGQPTLVAESPETFARPVYAPRLEADGWYELHAQAPGRPSLIRLGNQAGSWLDYGLLGPVVLRPYVQVSVPLDLDRP